MRIVMMLLMSLWLAPPLRAAVTYFSADAESGIVQPPWASPAGNPITTTEQAKTGSRSYKFREADPGVSPTTNGSKVLEFQQTKHASDAGGAYFSGWYRINEGYAVDQKWRNNIQWKCSNEGNTGCDGGAKTVIGFHSRTSDVNDNTKLQLVLSITGCGTAVVNNAGVTVKGGCAFSRTTPTQLVANTWYFFEVWYKAADTNGAIKVWQDGTLLFDVSGANFNTLTRPCQNAANGVPAGTQSTNTWVYFGTNSYSDPSINTAQSLYVDDFKITDFQVSADSGGDTTPPNAPTGLALSAVYPGHFQVSWNAPTGTGEQVDFATYNLERCEGFGCSTFTPVSGYNGTATSFLDTGLLRGEEYTYRVQACDDEGSPLCGAYDTEIANTTAGGLVAYWNADQGSGTTLTDVENTGTDHDGTLCNGATCPQQGPSWVAGHIGTNALSFDGTDDFVRVPDHSDLDFTASQDFTAQLWVNTTQGTSAGISPRIIGKHDASGGGWSLNLHEGTTDAKWFGRLVVGGTAIPTAPLDGCSDVNGLGWTHLALRRQGTILSTFQNGVLCNSFTDASVAGSLASAVNLNMGIRSDDTSHPYAGSLDDVRLYNYARSDTEIATDASPGATLALTAWRLHGVDAPLGTWKAGTNRSRKLRHNGSVAWRFQIHNTSGASASTPIALQCKLGQGSYVDAPEYLVDQEGSLNTECALAQSCVQADQVLSAGPDGTSVPYLPLPAGTTNDDYVQGKIVTSATWPSVTLAANELTEIQFRTAAVDIPDGSTLCCRPGKGENTPLDNYNVGTIGEACVNLHAGAAGLW